MLSSGWLSRTYWLQIKKTGTCCSLKPSEMTGQRDEWTVNAPPSPPTYISIEPLVVASSICNFKAPWENAGEGCVCLRRAGARVWLITHLCTLGELWLFSPFCVQSVRRGDGGVEDKRPIHTGDHRLYTWCFAERARQSTGEQN